MAGEINFRLDQIKKDFDPTLIAKQAHTFFKSHTPVRSGNARSHTFQSGNIIEADYPYAQRLDNGWSKQAPDGMSKPTIAYVLDLIKKKAQ